MTSFTTNALTRIHNAAYTFGHARDVWAVRVAVWLFGFFQPRERLVASMLSLANEQQRAVVVEALGSPTLSSQPALAALWLFAFSLMLSDALSNAWRIVLGVWVIGALVAVGVSGLRWPRARVLDVLTWAMSPFFLAAIIRVLAAGLTGDYSRMAAANNMAALCSLLLFPQLEQWRAGGQRGSARLWFVGLAALLLFASASRGAWLGVVAAVLVGRYFTGRRLWAALAAAAVAGGAWLLLNPRTGVDLRVELWGVAWQMFWQSPLLGGGPGSYASAWALAYPSQPLYPHAHNWLLHTLAEFGVIGTALSATVAWVVARGVWARRIEPLARGLSLSLVALAVHSLLDMPTWDLGICTALAVLVGAVFTAPRAPLSAWVPDDYGPVA